MYEVVSFQLIIDTSHFINSTKQIRTKDLIRAFLERNYRSLFKNQGKKGKALQQRFFHIERLRQNNIDTFRKELKYARKQMNIPGIPSFGLGGVNDPSLATPTKPDTRSTMKPKLDT